MILAAATLALASAILPQDSTLWELPAPAFANPAVKQWMLPRSHSSISAGYMRNLANRPTDMQEGRGEIEWHVGADSYIKYKSSTLWGDASYTAGSQRNLKWNETSDLQIVYPYVTADAVGGDMRLERYRFAGGYADHTSQWAWGATLSYDAGLYYRNVDPRPRNVTGRLDISAGAARHIGGDYFAGLGLSYRKYKQNCDIEFKNEINTEKLYHLTGLGTQYQRFAGLGDSYYYNGNRAGIVANLYPASGRGVMLTASFAGFTFNKVLADLNKLPLNHVRDDELSLNACYIGSSWGVAADWYAKRRHGFENIFGDASSGVYPQIAQLDMYADNRYGGRLTGMWQLRYSRATLWQIKASVGYDHRSEVYASPRRSKLVNRVPASADVTVSIPFAGAWRISFDSGADFVIPVKSRLQLSGADEQQPQGLIEMERYVFSYEKRAGHTLHARFALQRRVGRRLTLALAGSYAHTDYGLSTHRNNYSTSISVIF